MALDRETTDAWLRRYVAAWKTYDRGQIESLFSEDARYRFHPSDDPVTGRAAIVGAWLGEDDAAGASTRDAPGTYDATYTTVAVEGDVAVAVGSTSYRTQPGGAVDRVFDNCFVMRFDESGVCREFTEWFMERPKR
jgi:ketosteroid isomerase-like protein